MTLGGYDKSRLIEQSVEFTLSASDGMPRPLVRGIEIVALGDSSSKLGWGSRTRIVSDWDSSFIPAIDSTLPFLSLPEAVCDNMAKALNLTYNTTLDLYLLSDSQYNQFQEMNFLNLTFSLSSPDNNDNFGDPLAVDGVVNVTLPLAAFTSTLRYPFKNGDIKYGQSAVPYLSVRKSLDNTTTLGRSFLQETYLVTKYDEQKFSIHQAAFPHSGASAMDLAPIQQPDNSPYPSPGSKKSKGLTPGQMAGIAVGVIAAAAICLVGWFLFRRRRRGYQHRDRGH